MSEAGGTGGAAQHPLYEDHELRERTRLQGVRNRVPGDRANDLRGVLRARRGGVRLRRDAGQGHARVDRVRPELSGATRTCCRSRASRKAGLRSGFTPLVRAERLGQRAGRARAVHQGRQRQLPDLRATRSAWSRSRSRKAIEFGFDTVGCASTGNLANSVAAHAAQAGLRCRDLDPARPRDRAKCSATLIFGPRWSGSAATTTTSTGSAREIADKYGWAIVNVNLRPYYTEGAKTYGFEIAEQLGWRLPQHTVDPGRRRDDPAQGLQGLPGAHRPRPRRATTARGSTPRRPRAATRSSRAIQTGGDIIEPQKPNTIAKSIAIGNPADGSYAIRVVRDSGGSRPRPATSEIVDAIKLLARTEGIWTEPAGGTTLACAIKLIESGGSRGTSRSASRSRATGSRRSRRRRDGCPRCR